MYIVARTPGTGQCDDVQCELWLFGNYFRHSISVCSMVVVCQLKDHRLGSIGPFIVHRWTPRPAGGTNAADELASTAEPYMTVYIITVHTIPPLFHFLLFTLSRLFTVMTKVLSMYSTHLLCTKESFWMVYSLCTCPPVAVKHRKPTTTVRL